MIDRRLRNVALLVAACFFMEILDATIVVTAIPQMSASLGVSASWTALVITAYLLTLAALIPLSGWMTVRYGSPRVFLAAIALFTLASLGCALSRGDLLPGHASERTTYTVAFVLLALVALASTLDALRLHPSAGEPLVERRAAPAVR